MSVVEIVLVVLLDIIIIKGVKIVWPRYDRRHHRRIRFFIILQTVAAIFVIVFYSQLRNYSYDYRTVTLSFYLIGAVIAIYVPKAILALSLAADGIFKWRREKKYRFRKLHRKPSRHLSIWVGTLLAAGFFALSVWAVFVEQYEYRVYRTSFSFAMLPEKFDGFRIVQISDLHAGSMWGKAHKLQTVVDSINGLHPDMIVFTGDFVNNFADELLPVIPLFSRLTAPAGKIAILGNHDYGGYCKWTTQADSIANLRAIERNIACMGFKLLKNEAITIERDSVNSIALIGVENWGVKKRHPKRADLQKAIASVRHIPFKILLSHDPAFWPRFVTEKTDIRLTLSGHTHGTQMGIKTGEKRFSPVQIFYKYWVGSYRENDQYLYINPGLGVGGFPGRMGMPPEITVIELTKSR
ncbi:MAG: metallophosphoesterase [Bacteroidales bacterium]|jgi:predicted MPP superfamily phosphohydrolase|nr:metallophosphoesterase [Bacteroidales bacterium]